MLHFYSGKLLQIHSGVDKNIEAADMNDSLAPASFKPTFRVE